MKKVLVFGIFDGLHPGHVDFFRQAKKHGDFLAVAVGQPSASKKFKKKVPKRSLTERIKFVRNVMYVNKAMPGDREQGSYKVIEHEKPDIICLGYDQKELWRDLKKWLKAKNPKIDLKILRSYKSRTYHSSFLNG